MGEELFFLPVGGAGRFGMNLMFIGYKEDWLLIDTGIGFPDCNMAGIDLQIPDLDIVGEYRDMVKGIVITHAHEDHIGALPYVYNVCPADVYAPHFVKSLMNLRIGDFPVPVPPIHTVEPYQEVEFGALKVKWVPVTHSIPDSYALVIETPKGIVVHTGDFKIDPVPYDGRHFATEEFERLGEKGVLALLADSTNAEERGHTRPERDLVPRFKEIFEQAEGRVLLTMFASNVFRLAMIKEAADAAGRRIALLGRSLENYLTAARRAGFKLPEFDLLDPKMLEHYPDHKVVVVCTGSQGEPLATLPRASRKDHELLHIHPGDTVVFSSRMIPGNEKRILDMMNGLVEQGATILHTKNADVHVSGHAKQEELLWMIRTLRPKVFIPIHGELTYMAANKALAEGEDVEYPLLVQEGYMYDLASDPPQLIEKVPISHHFVDADVIGTAEELALREKARAAWRGIIAAKVRVKRGRKRLSGEASIQTYALYTNNGHLIEDAEEYIKGELKQMPADSHYNLIQDVVKARIRGFFKRRIGKKPEILLFLDVD